MEININYLAVLVSAIASMVLGSLWYGPLFGKTWMSLSGKTEADLAAAKAKGMGKSYALMFIGSMVMSYVLAHGLIFASAYTKTYGAQAGLMVGFWSWFGFIAPVSLGIVLWDNKPWKLWFLNNGYHLINLLIIGVILALWK